jgi:hypothetical protein
VSEAPAPLTFEGLHDGWAFGIGPELWPVTVEQRGGTPNQPPGLHLVCALEGCGQSMTRLGNWAHTLASLKPQIAAHVMQVHLELTVR